GPLDERFCHSDTWAELPAFCDFQKTTVKNKATGTVASFLTADTEYNPTVNPNCNPQNSGIVTLTVYANPIETDQNQTKVTLEEIDQSTITVNGHAVKQQSDGSFCSTNSNVMICQIPKCVNGDNIINEISADGTSTLVMQALMKDKKTTLMGD